MAGGRGARFWPRSREKSPKHLLDIISAETILRETIKRIAPIVSPDRIFIIAGESHAAEVRKQLPELPREKRKRFVKQYGIREEEAFAICLEKETADGFEQIATKTDAKNAARFMRGVLRKQLNYRDLSFSESGLSVEGIAELLELLNAGQVTERVGEQLLVKMLDEKIAPRHYAAEHGLLGVQAAGELEGLVAKVLKENPQAVADYKAGNEKSLHFLAGQVMKESRGRADPAAVQELLKKKIG